MYPTQNGEQHWERDYIKNILEDLKDKGDLSLETLNQNLVIPNKLAQRLIEEGLSLRDIRAYADFTNNILEKVNGIGLKGVGSIETILNFFDLEFKSIENLSGKKIDNIITNACLGKYGINFRIRDAVILYNLTEWRTIEDIKYNSEKIPQIIDQVRDMRFHSNNDIQRARCLNVIAFLEKHVG
jgi:hypothetical protein